MKTFNQAEWARRTRLNRKRRKARNDPLWRLANLYAINSENQGLIPFHPTPEQARIIWELHVNNRQRLIIPKARQLGISTVLCLIGLDWCLWCRGWTSALIDKTALDAKDKLQKKVRLAWNNLEDPVIHALEIPRGQNHKAEIAFTNSKWKRRAPSVYRAGATIRGGNCQFLHISEWGTIQFTDPARSEEIKTGSVEAAEQGRIVIETTWKGGKGGHLWSYIEAAQAIPDARKSPRDWMILFFPWYTKPAYTATGPVDSATSAYLNEMEARVGVTFTPGQRAWYAAKKREQGIFMKREYPTTLEECWQVPVEGAIYAEAIDRARSEGRVAPMPIDPNALVHTWWDLGSPQNTVVWYGQIVGREIRLIDCDRDLNLTLVARVARMLGKGYQYGHHFLPHDALQTERSGRTMATELRATGLTNVRIVPVCKDIWVGINHALELMPSIAFRTPQCETALTALEAYHYKRESTGSRTADLPVHDQTSHTADAFRTMAEAHQAGMFSFKYTATNSEESEHQFLPHYFHHEPKRRRPNAPIRVGG